MFAAPVAAGELPRRISERKEPFYGTKKVPCTIAGRFEKSGLHVHQARSPSDRPDRRILRSDHDQPGCFVPVNHKQAGLSMASYLPTPKSKQPKPKKNREKPMPPEPEQKRSPEPHVPSDQNPEFPPIRSFRPRRLPEWFKGILSTLAFTVVILSGVYVFLFIREFIGSGGKSIDVFHPLNVGGTPAPGVTPSPLPLAGPGYVPWNGVDRVTILVMGLDYREGGPETNTGTSRTDTMILFSMDPVKKTGVMLSIPRDLYVDIPGYGFNRINEAYFIAETNRLDIGGPGLAMQTVENLLGIPINYYAVIDFNTFITIVNEIGGIDVYVPFDNMPVDSAEAGKIRLLFYGWNHLTGSEALSYARARNTTNYDYDRAARTQQVILAIRDKVLSLNMIPTLLAKAPTLWAELSNGIIHNMNFELIIQLALAAKDIPRKNIRQAIIDESCMLADENINGQLVEIPNLEKVRELRDSLFSSDGPLGYATPPADLDALAFKENAKIEIVNGTLTTGLAARTKELLIRHGFSADNIKTRDATEKELNDNPAYTLITDYSGKPYTVRLLYNLMNLSSENLRTDIKMDKSESDPDIQIFLKYDWIVPQD
jgi:LCP family protein required for cell wall assembly